ncbi:ORF6N domain-containing protein [Symbiopectobacterium purcellii]|uniref:ORF6N domain-containing protein n=1 Tax=Symbiopectobacterium purcellii TaxID=2871826 RepID=A0ABX9AK80_9ENTR|nr:ORF6N domain-containing protein [Symbiopectobacterium purcellii]QZN94125.1 ORF6N domain-containing protein [Symbiopectobacterium purcellii]
MANQITVEVLPSIIHNQIPVVTTDLLANLYCTDVTNIKMNFSRNQDRFVVGKHYYKLEGIELKDFKNKVTESYLVAPRTKHLILWTERGAARHAKMLEIDQAWEVFEKLEDCYFNQRQQDLFDTDSAITVTIPREGRWLVCYRNRQHQIINIDGKDCVEGEYIRKLRRDAHLLVQTLQDFGYRTLVMSGDTSPGRLDRPLIKEH